MYHLNGSVLCAIDLETTGKVPGVHDIINICILPLTHMLIPNTKIIPFYMTLVPKRPNARDKGKCGELRLAKIILEGSDPDEAIDLLQNWYEKLWNGRPKFIAPIANNWPIKKAFLVDWLGSTMVAELFDKYYRDLMCAGVYCNDKSAFMGELYNYPKPDLTTISYRLKARTAEGGKDVMTTCRVIAESYKRMLGNYV